MNCVAVTLQSHCQVSRQGTSLQLETHVSCGRKNDGKNCRSLYFASIKKQTAYLKLTQYTIGNGRLKHCSHRQMYLAKQVDNVSLQKIIVVV